MFRLLSLALLLAASSAWSATPRLEIPRFSDLRAKAVESTELTFGPLTLGLARWLLRHDPDGDTAALLRDMKRVVIRHYEFAADFAVPESRMQAIRSQLAAPGWSQLVQARDADGEDVGIYVARDDGQIKGLAIVAVEPRELTIVHVIGRLDPAMIGRWQVEVLEGPAGP